jgi:hypothetical protein
MSKITERNVLINSSLIRIIAALLTTIVHEFGHFAVSIAMGNAAVLFHNRVETPEENLSFVNQLLIPLGGPMISLAQGILCMLIYKKIKNGPVALLILWMGISGLMAFFGYMMIAPIFTVGDTGRIFQLLEIPMLWQIVIAVASLLLFTLLLMRFHKGFEHFIPENIDSKKEMRAKWAKLLILYPVLFGIVVLTLMQFPIVNFLSLLPSLTMPFMLFMSYGMMIMSKDQIRKADNKKVTKISVPVIILFLIVIIGYRLLTLGFSL